MPNGLGCSEGQDPFLSLIGAAAADSTGALRGARGGHRGGHCTLTVVCMFQICRPGLCVTSVSSSPHIHASGNVQDLPASTWVAPVLGLVGLMPPH